MGHRVYKRESFSVFCSCQAFSICVFRNSSFAVYCKSSPGANVEMLLLLPSGPPGAGGAGEQQTISRTITVMSDLRARATGPPSKKRVRDADLRLHPKAVAPRPSSPSTNGSAARKCHLQQGGDSEPSFVSLIRTTRTFLKEPRCLSFAQSLMPTSRLGPAVGPAARPFPKAHPGQTVERPLPPTPRQENEGRYNC